MNGKQEKPVCLDCDKSKQSNLPSTDDISSSGQPCEEIYERVSDCMKHHNGQIAKCTKEWEIFKTCHSEQKRLR